MCFWLLVASLRHLVDLWHCYKEHRIVRRVYHYCGYLSSLLVKVTEKGHWKFYFIGHWMFGLFLTSARRSCRVWKNLEFIHWKCRKIQTPDSLGGSLGSIKLQRKKSQKTPKPTTGRVFTSTHATPGVSFAAVPRGTHEQHLRPRAPQAPAEKQSSPTSVPQQKTGQSVQASDINSVSLDNVATMESAKPFDGLQLCL
jgi:hypothetical protein